MCAPFCGHGGRRASQLRRDPETVIIAQEHCPGLFQPTWGAPVTPTATGLVTPHVRPIPPKGIRDRVIVSYHIKRTYERSLRDHRVHRREPSHGLPPIEGHPAGPGSPSVTDRLSRDTASHAGSAARAGRTRRRSARPCVPRRKRSTVDDRSSVLASAPDMSGNQHRRRASRWIHMHLGASGRPYGRRRLAAHGTHQGGRQ